MDKEGDLDRRDFSLHRRTFADVGGLIFVCLARDPIPFDEAGPRSARCCSHRGSSAPKVAATRRYEVRANWKLVWENNRECWHCNLNHPQYIKANYDNAPIDDAALKQEIEARARATSARLEADGVVIDHQEAGMVRFPSRDLLVVYQPHAAGAGLGQRVDGRPAGGAADGRLFHARRGHPAQMRTMPNFWDHASSDHAVSTRLAPAGPQKDARAGSVARPRGRRRRQGLHAGGAAPVLELTSEQDWDLCEKNPGRRELLGVHAGSLLHQARVQCDPLHGVVPAGNRPSRSAQRLDRDQHPVYPIYNGRPGPTT